MAELMQYEKSERFTPREKVALRYADAIMYDPAQADDVLWAALHKEFTQPELVELGYWVGFTFGGQRWLKTLGAVQGEFAAEIKARSRSKPDVAARAPAGGKKSAAGRKPTESRARRGR